jgi:hypothetical protein
MLPIYVITRSEHNGVGLSKDYNGISSVPKSATGSTKNTTAKCIGTLQGRNVSTCIERDRE